jgi:serine/threonine protein kinase
LIDSYSVDGFLTATNFSCLFYASCSTSHSKFIFKWLLPSRRVSHELEANRIFSGRPFMASAVLAFPSHGSRGLLLPLYSGGDLFAYCATRGALPEAHVRALAAPVVCALSTMHQCGWAHLDVKPENILLGDESPVPKSVLADFGLAQPIGARKFTNPCGTIDYHAPELLAGNPFDKAVDMWALGVTLFIMITGSAPFPSAEVDEYEFTVAVLDGEYAKEKLDAVCASEECKEIIAALLSLRADERITAEEAAAHPFFRAMPEPAAIKGAAARLIPDDRDYADRPPGP